MSNPIREAMETISIKNSIAERKSIIERYKLYGALDRDDAIRKILELRHTDDKVSAVTIANLVKGARPFDDCSNLQLVNELQMQVDILEAELLEKTMKRNEE